MPRIVLVVSVLLLTVPALARSQTPESWTMPRTPDGRPDLQGRGLGPSMVNNNAVLNPLDGTSSAEEAGSRSKGRLGQRLKHPKDANPVLSTRQCFWRSARS